MKIFRKSVKFILRPLLYLFPGIIRLKNDLDYYNQLNNLRSKYINSYKKENKYVGTFNQDQWVINDVYKGKKNGYFVELGALNGIKKSNTFLLEYFFDWTGICIEPNPVHFKGLKKFRKCIRLNDCIDGVVQNVEFLSYKTTGGIIDSDTDNSPSKRREIIDSGRNLGMTSTLKTKTLWQVLEENNAPKVIEYLSLDVEGAETRILRDFPFDVYTFLCMSIENPTDELEKIFLKNGYRRIKKINIPNSPKYEALYLHNSFSEIEKYLKNET